MNIPEIIITGNLHFKGGAKDLINLSSIFKGMISRYKIANTNGISYTSALQHSALQKV